ncbi:hypothetical protein HYH03_008012 [Edaphochlamys debaryana]|uniref:Uncharacterized protein n=1 Tax=Edaphochlamys debaryana TaxID=47281 RepID=A0A835Y237_9CHLO|nr:hypothetical protein HYH03_008012 [Edaphochlamys debaryana]|eukprot:KAG2493792.1 hypothetical protein HYH03_008012 [Edaphochlamys debaryana]
MAAGGNLRGRQFFKQHGWDEIGADKIESKYTSRAAQLYRALLEKEVQKASSQQLLQQSLVHEKDTVRGEAGGDLADFKRFDEPAAPAPAPAVTETNGAGAAAEEVAEGAAEAAKPAAAAKPATISKPRTTAAKKTGGKLGLGVKKLDAKVDDSIYAQAPAPEPVKVEITPGMPAASTSGGGAPPAGSRFAYDTLTQEAPAAQRGKDGHLTIGAGGSDFFGGTGPKPSGRSGGGAPPKLQEPTREVQDATLKKFNNAKAISSRDFQQAAEGETDNDRQQRLTKFQGATAISSADYYGRSESRGSGPGPTSSGDLDISAADIVNRLSFQAKQDMQQMKNMAAAAGRKVAGMATKIIGDLNRMNG